MHQPRETTRGERRLDNGIYLYCIAAAIGLLALSAWTILVQRDYGPGIIGLIGFLALIAAYLVDRTGEGSLLD